MSKTAGKFSREVTGRKSSLQNDWLIFRKGVRGLYFFVWRDLFSSAVFSNFQELQLNNDLAGFSQIWPDTRKIFNKKNSVREFDNSKLLYLKAISVRSLGMFFSQFLKCSVTFERNRIELEHLSGDLDLGNSCS